jgi:iron complex outermembrane recepter protein
MKFIYTILFLITTHLAIAQKATIIITVSSKTNEKVNGANVVLKKFEDSTIIDTKQTSNGMVQFEGELNQRYFLTISSVGYAEVQKTILINSATENIGIVLKQKVANNKAVTVVAKKPLMKQEDDKTIVDPENLVQASTNAFEVLEKTPGIFTDQDGNFYLSSTTPATVQINGRDMRLGANDLATLLKSLPPNSILKIEIVRTPSAKNDATGSGGVINIVLKKGVKLGLTGSVFGGINQGTYGNQFMGASINNSDDKKTVYAYAGFSKRATYDELKTNRAFNVDSLLKQNSFSKIEAWNPYVNMGASYMPNKNWDFGYDANVSFNKSDNVADNLNNIISTITNNTAISNNNNVVNDGSTVSIIQNINAKFKSDSNKLEWSSNVSYNYFKYDNSQDYNTINSIPFPISVLGNGDQKSDRNLTVIQTDLTWKPIKRLTIETGAKTSIIGYKNTADFFRNNVKDIYRSNQFKYTENITALYLQAAKTIEKFVLKAGVRMEHTNMKGTQLVPTAQSFSINRNDFFPYVYLSRPVATIFKYSLKGYLVYRKSISRPGYDLLNPFPRFVDNYLSEVGNPNLKPQFTETFEANISFEDQPVFAVGRNQTKGIFTNVIYQNPNNPSEALRTYDNLGNNTENYLRFTAALPPGGKYFFVVGGQRNFNIYDGLYEGKPLNFKNRSWNFFTYHELKLDKRSSLSMNGWMQTGGLFQFYQLSDFGQLNFNLNRRFFNKKLIVSLNFRDVFFTNKNDFKILQGSVNATGSRITDSRRFGINIRYNFGMKKKEEQAPQYGTGPEGN